ncbi:hypothetical protein PV327_004156 [Microctonus hyperodae]|uniref:Exonuclease domain-containing protein n=1 Tax=Microctonus hyperodae TaxID=165561 RepID=A0AA39FBT3_MICHY|nr:hypothetical protein PV327_004156 [Microctonus hyperodae]
MAEQTAGFHLGADILQIALKFSDKTFSVYVKPTQQISTHASESNGLTSHGQDLFYYGRKVSSVTLSKALDELLSFLKTFENPCIMVAHNCPFDAPRLLRAIKNEKLLDEFRIVISSFQDTLKLFKQKFPDRKGSKKLSLTTLASETLSLCTKKAHNAEYDVYMLEELVEKHLSISDIVNKTLTFDNFLQNLNQQELSTAILPSFKPINDLVSSVIIERIAMAGINYESILKIFKGDGTENTIKLLQQNENGVPQIVV